MMKSLKLVSIAGAALLLLSGCSAFVDTNTVANMPNKGNAFQQALHKEYMAQAMLEKAEDDGADAQYFVDKAKAAALGEDVGPQPISERMIPDAFKAEISEARKNLVDKLWNGGADETPHAAAKAQAMFDCWLQEQEENNQPADVAACKSGFEMAYAMIKTAAPAPAAAAPKPMKKVMTPPAPMPVPYVVYFNTNSADLDDAAMVVLKQAFADFRLRKPGSLRIAGHTDTQGDKQYNMTLSQKRSDAVMKALATLGVPAKSISESSHGEEALAVGTGDNKAERNNRRVSITFVR